MKVISLILVLSLVFIIGCEKKNIPPICEITSPNYGAVYEVGDIITISVEAEDEDGLIEEVSFYIDDIEVASASRFPFNYDWDTEEVDDGIKKIRVSVEDDQGATAEDEISILLKLAIEAGTLTDIDGNVYETVSIGTKEWMAENLKVTHYFNGLAIPLVTDSTAWANLANNNTDDAYCYYNNNSSSKHGALYTYAAALKACPSGWHLPSDAEWTELENYLADNGYNFDGTTGGGRDMIAKAMATSSGWSLSTTTGGVGNSDYPEKRNASGFSGLPGGSRSDDTGAFGDAGYYGYWWSSTENSSSYAVYRSLSYSNASVYQGDSNKSSGFSIRCVRDD